MCVKSHSPVGISAIKYAMKKEDPTFEKSLPLNFRSFDMPITLAYCNWLLWLYKIILYHTYINHDPIHVSSRMQLEIGKPYLSTNCIT